MAMPPTSDDNEDNVMDDPAQEDNSTPFNPPASPRTDPQQDIDTEIESAEIDDTHQATDSSLDSQEVYDEGVSGAAEATEPNAGNTAVGYDPDKDQRKDAEA